MFYYTCCAFSLAAEDNNEDHSEEHSLRMNEHLDPLLRTNGAEVKYGGKALINIYFILFYFYVNIILASHEFKDLSLCLESGNFKKINWLIV